jgi:hypothetical protein
MRARNSPHKAETDLEEIFFSYTWTDRSALAPRSALCINELRRQEIIEWE